MKNKEIYIAGGIIVIIAFVILLSGALGLPLGGRSGGDANEILTTVTSNLSNAWSEHPVYSGSAVLNKVVVGEAETGGQIAIFDTTGTPSTDSIIFTVTGSSAQVWELGVKIDSGITVNTTDQNNVMFYYTSD